MLSMDEPDEALGGDTAGAIGPCVTARIVRAEERMSLMQSFTAYVIQVSDFGRTSEVPKRFSDFEALHQALVIENPGLQLPPMPPKGVSSTDAAVVAQRKVDLDKLLGAMLRSPEVLVEKQLHLWKFLGLPNPTVIAGRFVTVPRSRPRTLQTLTKLVTEPKYQDDVYRLAFPATTDLLMEGLRELRGGDPERDHWCRQQDGRKIICQLLGGALGHSDSTRQRLIEADVVALLLGLVERDEAALDDARIALNVIVAREAEKFPSLLAAFLRRGGLSQLAVLAQRPKCQEFVAKLLWLAWDAQTRAPFVQPGGQGLRVLQALMNAASPTCSLLGAVLLSGLIASGDFDTEPAHRLEALRLVRGVLSRPEVAANDMQFAKTLCGASSALVRLAALLEDVDLAPLVLGLLCAAKPPAAKLSQISGNLAGLVNDKYGSAHTEETRARAAELLLHIQGGGGGALGSRPSQSSSATGQTASLDLERCEGIASHEEGIERALKSQFEEAVSKSQEELSLRAAGVQDVALRARHRLQAPPLLDFQAFDRAFASFKLSREALEKVVRESEDLHRAMERQLQELRNARPSSVDPQSYKERLLAAERLYSEVKAQREAFASADADAKEKQQKAQASSNDFRRAAEEVRRVEEEASTLRIQRTEKETSATKLRHKANTPSLEAMKQQAREALERNQDEARKLQVIGQRVQQGDPDYLKEGESRDQKIAELASKLSQLKKQHQQLLQQQKEYDFDPVALNDQASRLEAEARELGVRIDSLELRRLEAERERTEKSSLSTRESEEARLAQERRTSLSSRAKAAEQEASSQLAALRPLIQEHHSGWQRLLGQQKKLDADHRALGGRLDEAQRATQLEASGREELKAQITELATGLYQLQQFLEQVGEEPPDAPPPAAVREFSPQPRAAPAAAAAAVASAVAADPFGADDSDPFAMPGAPSSPAAAAAPAAPAAPDSSLFAETGASSAAPASAEEPPLLVSPPAATVPSAAPAEAAGEAPAPAAMDDDDFDAFLREGDAGAAPAAAPAAAGGSEDPF